MSEIIRDPEEQNNILRGFKEDMEKGFSTESGTIDRRYERNPNAESVSANPLLGDVCRWEITDIDELDRAEHETDCGRTFYFNDGDSSSNGFQFCPFCGKQITVTAELGDLE